MFVSNCKMHTIKIHSSSNIRIKELTNRTGGHSCHYLFDGCAKTRTETTHGPNSSHDIKETPVMGNVLPKERPRNFSEAMLEGELQETGCNRNGCNATETCIFSSYSQGIHMPLWDIVRAFSHPSPAECTVCWISFQCMYIHKVCLLQPVMSVPGA